MPRRRTSLLTGLVVVLGAAGGVLAVTATNKPRVTRVRMERVAVGMTREEVEATVGCPPGPYEPGEESMRPAWAAEAGYEVWYGSDCHLVVEIRNDRAVYVFIHELHPGRSAPLRRIRSRLGL